MAGEFLMGQKNLVPLHYKLQKWKSSSWGFLSSVPWPLLMECLYARSCGCVAAIRPAAWRRGSALGPHGWHDMKRHAGEKQTAKLPVRARVLFATWSSPSLCGYIYPPRVQLWQIITWVFLTWRCNDRETKEVRVTWRKDALLKFWLPISHRKGEWPSFAHFHFFVYCISAVVIGIDVWLPYV